MTADDIIAPFAEAGRVFPERAMHEAVARWDEIAPPLLALLDACADGTDRSERTMNVLFFALHLIGQMREQRAFAPLCRLAHDGEVVEKVLRDGITDTFAPILISCFDGDFARLQALIEDADADEFVRNLSFDTLAYLTASGAVAPVVTERYLRDVFATLRPQEDSVV